MEERSPMNFLMPAAGGVIGGLVGAAVWAAIAHFAHREVGWVAWGVGGLVGLGVRVAAGDRDGPAFGVLAVLAVLGGKFAAAHLIAGEVRDALVAVTDDDLMVPLAQAVVKERAAKGQKVMFLPGRSADTATELAEFPPEIRTEAAKRWNQLPPAEQQQRRAAETKQRAVFGVIVGAGAREGIFRGSFSPYDLLWFGLATFTAFRIGSGVTSDD
jgi:hypothetical protein